MPEKARPAGQSGATQDTAPDTSGANPKKNADLNTTSIHPTSGLSPIPILAIAAALLWWASSFAFLAGRLHGAADHIPLSDIVGATGMAVIPGLILILSGLLGQAMLRLRQSEQHMISASSSLLKPVRTSETQINNIGQALASHARKMNEILSSAQNSAKNASTNIQNSCAQLEIAAGNAKNTTAICVNSLNNENQRLATIVETLAQSVDTLKNTISNHHTTVSGALADTRNVVENADSSLEMRMNALNQVSTTITSKIGELDQIAGHADRSAKILNSVLEQLESRIEAAAAQMAAYAQAGSAMENASRGAVSILENSSENAIRNANAVCQQLSERANQISLNVDDALKELSNAQNEAHAKAKNVVRTARVESSTAETRIRELGNNLFETAAEATRIAEAGLDTARARIEKASRLLGGHQDTPSDPNKPPSFNDTPSNDDPPDQDDPPHPQTPQTPQTRRTSVAPTELRAISSSQKIGPEQHSHKIISEKSNLPKNHPARSPAKSSDAARRTLASTSWKDILSDIDHDPTLVNQNAAEVIDLLNRAGVSARRAITAPDLRRIADAAELGEYQRRMAVTKAAPAHLNTVTNLMTENKKLTTTAENFVVGWQENLLEQLKIPGAGDSDLRAKVIAWLLADTALAKGNDPSDAQTATQTNTAKSPEPAQTSNEISKTRNT